MTNNDPLVTCIILTYNKFEYIFEALQSILDQEYPCIELIVSDDGSTNFPEERIHEFIQKYKKSNLKRILIFANKKNVGTVRHANFTVRNAAGKYIMWLGQDDVFYEACTVNKVVDRMDKTNADFICCRRLWCTEKNLTELKYMPEDMFLKKIKNWNTAEKQYKALAKGRYYFAFIGATTYYKRDFLKERNYFDENYILSEDAVLYMQYTRSGKIIPFADDIISIYYRKGGVSTGEQRNLTLYKDDCKRFEIEVLPFLNRFNFFDRRYIRFRGNKLCKFTEMNKYQKVLFAIKYLDMCILSKYYFWRDEILMKINDIFEKSELEEERHANGQHKNN